MLRNIFTITRFLMLPFSLFTLTIMFAVQAKSENKGAFPDLSSKEAINFLKKSNRYDSLAEAVKTNVGGKSASSTQSVVSTTPKLIASDGAADDYFGYSVSISGNYAVVGAPYDNDGINPNEGSAYIFEFNGTNWIFNAKLTPFDGAADDNFGWSVDIHDDIIIIGSPNDDVSYPNQGSAYVWRGITGFGWNPEGKIVAADGQAGDQFGYRVAVSNNSFAISAPLDDYGTFIDKGSVYVYSGLTQQAKFSPPDVASGDRFGNGVDISGDSLIAGSPGDDIDSKIDQGSAHIFTRTGANWNHVTKLTAYEGEQSDNFGAAVAISGGNILIGSPGDDINGKHDQGSTYFGEYSGSEGWVLREQLFDNNGAAGDQFGRSVSVSGGNMAVGAYKADVGANVDQGAAYRFVYLGSGAPISRFKITAPDGAAGDGFGISVAVDDRNFIFGSYLDNIGANDNQGSAYMRRF